MHVENRMKPQDGKRCGEYCKCATMDTCHGLRGLVIDLPDKMWACRVGPGRVDEFTDCGLQQTVDNVLFVNRQKQG